MGHRSTTAEQASDVARRKRQASKKRRRRARMIRRGECVNCGVTHTAKRQKCDKCAEQAATKARNSYYERRAAGLCKCGKRATQEFKQCNECRYRDRERRRPLTMTQTECESCGRWLYDDERCCNDR